MSLHRVPMPRARTRLKPVSDKRRKQNTERAKVVMEMTGGHPVPCFTGCGRWADDAHELLSRARGGSITDPGNIRPACRTCHTRITREPAWAEVNGYALPSPLRRGKTT